MARQKGTQDVTGPELFASLAPKGPKLVLPHKPWPKQQLFLDLDCEEAFYGGAAGGGKSDALLDAALKYRDVPGYSAILFRKTYTDLALPDAIMDRAHKWLAGTAARWDGVNKTYLLPTYGKPASLTFGFMDGPRDRYRYQGAMVQFAGFDEVTQFLEAEYLYLFSRLRRLVGMDIPWRMRCAGNPGGVGHEWVGKRFGIVDGYDPAVVHAGPDGRVFVPARLEDNPSLDREAYERALEKLDQVTYQQLRHGRWIVDSSELVYSFNTRANLCDKLPDIAPRKWTKVFAADFGVTDPTAFAVWAFEEHTEAAYLIESDEWPGLSPSEAADIARAWEDRHGGFDRIIGDLGGLGKGFAAEWRKRFAIPIEAAQKPNKLGFIKLFNGDLQHQRAMVLRTGNEKFVECITALRWKDDKHQVEHQSLPNHLTDAALYGWRECRAWDWSEQAKAYPVGTADYERAREEQRMKKLAEAFEREQSDEQDYYSSDNEWIRGVG
jgi:hypothetical protein